MVFSSECRRNFQFYDLNLNMYFLLTEVTSVCLIVIYKLDEIHILSLETHLLVSPQQLVVVLVLPVSEEKKQMNICFVVV